MSKAILVIDMPDSCSECPFFLDYYRDMCCRANRNQGIDYPYPKDFRQKWCPLKPVPPKTEVWDKYDEGYNEAIEEILWRESK